MRKFDISEFSFFLKQPNKIELPHSWIEHIPFAFFIMELVKPDTFVELGVHSANSYNAFCQAVLSLKLNTICYGVDTWKGDKQAGFYNEDIFIHVKKHQDINYSNFSTLIRLTFDEALDHFQDGRIDLLHIDGCHNYEAVKHDYNNWLPKMSSNGIILFHDIAETGEGFGA